MPDCTETPHLRWFSPDLDIAAVPFCEMCLFDLLTPERLRQPKS
jgi:hypothetical protein